MLHPDASGLHQHTLAHFLLISLFRRAELADTAVTHSFIHSYAEARRASHMRMSMEHAHGVPP